MEKIFCSIVQLFKFCLFIAPGGIWNCIFFISTAWETAPLTRETTGDLLALLIYLLFLRDPQLSVHTARQLRWLCNWEDHQKCSYKKENRTEVLFVILGCLPVFALLEHYQQWVPSTQAPLCSCSTAGCRGKARAPLWDENIVLWGDERAQPHSMKNPSRYDLPDWQNVFFFSQPYSILQNQVTN